VIVRLFSYPEMTELGAHTRAFIDVVLVDLAFPIRMLPPPTPNSHVNFAELDPAWQPYRDLFATVIDGPYANVVSSNEPSEWNRLWTTNVTNVLLTTTVPPPMHPEHIIYQGAYQAVIVPAPDGGVDSGGDLHRAWVLATKCPVIVLPRLWTGHHAQAIRSALIT